MAGIPAPPLTSAAAFAPPPASVSCGGGGGDGAGGRYSVQHLGPGISIVDVEELTAYKVIGTERTLLEYAAKPPRCGGGRSDWSGVYLQYSAVHAAGTIGYRWDQGYETAAMARVTLRGLRVVVVAGGCFADGTMNGAQKAQLIKAYLRDEGGVCLDDDDLLVTALGQRGLSLTCLETEGEWELVMSPDLLEASLADEVVVDEYRSRHGSTSHRREAVEGAAWVRYGDEEEAARLLMPTPAPDFLLPFTCN